MSSKETKRYDSVLNCLRLTKHQIEKWAKQVRENKHLDARTEFNKVLSAIDSIALGLSVRPICVSKILDERGYWLITHDGVAVVADVGVDLDEELFEVAFSMCGDSNALLILSEIC